MLADTAVNVFLFLAAILPVLGLIWFSWWFLRAGKRYDEEEERAAGRRPPS